MFEKMDPNDYAYRLVPRPQDPESWTAKGLCLSNGKTFDINHYALLPGYGLNLTTKKGCHNMAFTILVSYLQFFKDMMLNKAKSLIGSHPDVLDEFYNKFFEPILFMVKDGRTFEIPVSKVSEFSRFQFEIQTVSPPAPAWLDELIPESSMLNGYKMCACGSTMVLVKQSVHTDNPTNNGILRRMEWKEELWKEEFWECRGCGRREPF